MQKIHSVSVRALAEFAFEKGDLIPARRAAARMREGVRGHQALQQLLPVTWRSEVDVSRDIPVEGHILRVHGRADGVYLDRDCVRVLEIKTTARDPSSILKYDYPVHWAQGEIYAALFCLNEGAEQAEVRLTDQGVRKFQLIVKNSASVSSLATKLLTPTVPIRVLRTIVLPARMNAARTKYCAADLAKPVLLLKTSFLFIV